MKRTIGLIVSIALFVAAITSCSIFNSDIRALKLTKSNLPKIDGSTANIPLIKCFISKALGVDLNEIEQYYKVSGTDNSYNNLINEQADILFVYEASDVTKKQDYFKDIEIAPIGRDALVFITNRNNPVNGLSTADLQAIYTGEIKNWKDFGGEDKEIVAFQRNKLSGSQTMMEKLCMKGKKMIKAQSDREITVMGELLTSVKNYDNTSNAIGYSVFYYAGTMLKNPELKFLDVDNVKPTNKTIKEGKYPFINNFYVAIRKDEPTDSITRRIFEYMQSDSGQKLVSECGYVSIK